MNPKNLDVNTKSIERLHYKCPHTSCMLQFVCKHLLNFLKYLSDKEL